ncbi:MAG: 2-oxoglutarate ferredoxin oxidoreductase subunit beta [Planctomycetota bacterium]|nr:MAG: 2-oxoglutarate ferredoxin oxidoreductase subunit beta [Planctomycetota bacterium]
MSTAATPAASGGLSKKDFASDQEVRWCPGCGDYAILSAVQRVLPELGIPREKIVFISGIGCSSRFPYYMNTYGFHTIHGRAPAIATGLKLANPELTVFVVTGDGDGLSIGGNHLMHVLRRNVDLTILLFNNRIYGLTKGQYSPTSEQGKVTKSTPYGSIDRPLDPVRVALGAGASFVARTIDRNLPHLQETLRRAVAHRGTSFVEIYQNCNIYNDGAFAPLTDKETREAAVVELVHGRPLVFGRPGERRALRLRGLVPEVVPYAEGSTSGAEGGGADGGLWVHDEHDRRLALLLAELEPPAMPVPMGVLLDLEAPEFIAAHMEQERRVTQTQGPGDLERLLRGPETWTVRES